MSTRYRIWIESDGGPLLVVEVKDMDDIEKKREFSGKFLKSLLGKASGQIEEWEKGNGGE